MRSRYQAREANRAYFITSTIVEWLPVFTTAACCDLLVSSLEYCRQHALKIYAWVILDNNSIAPIRSARGAILSAPDLSACVRDLKSFTAQRILDQVALEHREWLLNQFRFYRPRHKPNTHQVWQEGSHPQLIAGDEMMIGKFEYVHRNPVKRGMVSVPEHWRYSSAPEQLPLASPVLRCDPWR